MKNLETLYQKVGNDLKTPVGDVFYDLYFMSSEPCFVEIRQRFNFYGILKTKSWAASALFKHKSDQYISRRHLLKLRNKGVTFENLMEYVATPITETY